ncbi:MAG: hypothetical protein IJK39_06455 [Bacteroidales bacterium]|nr:hypothetical protein [Bacteroidales bacterium]
MNKIIRAILIVICLLYILASPSCLISHKAVLGSPDIWVFGEQARGKIISINHFRKRFELYDNDISIIGQYHLMNDTISLNPYYYISGSYIAIIKEPHRYVAGICNDSIITALSSKYLLLHRNNKLYGLKEVNSNKVYRILFYNNENNEK